MNEYIESLRKLGYLDFIQVVKLVIQDKSDRIEFYYNFSQELSVQVDLKKYSFTGIWFQTDEYKKLEILYLVFSDRSKTAFYQDTLPIGFFSKPYWNQLRNYLGHEVVYSPSCVMIVEKDDFILAVKRTDDGRWSLPAGAKELGDDLEQTVHKEALEEVGIRLHDLKLIAIQTGSKMFWRYPNGNQMHFISFVFLAKTNDLPKLSDDENTEWEWISLVEAERIFEPRWLMRLNYHKQFKNNIIID